MGIKHSSASPLRLAPSSSNFHSSTLIHMTASPDAYTPTPPNPPVSNLNPPTSNLQPQTSNLQSPDRLILLALLLGLAVDFLFFDKPLGLSFPIFIFLCVSILISLAVAERAHPAFSSLWLFFPMVGFSIMVFVRAEPLTTFVNVCLALALGVLWARTFTGGGLFRFGLIDFGLNYFLGGMETLLRPWPVLVSSGKQTMSAEGRRQWLMPVARGLILAAPVLCIFSFLLSSADLVFADRLRDLLEYLNLDNIPELIQRAFIVGVAAFLAIGLLIQSLRPLRYTLVGEDGKLIPRILGSIESTIILGSINLLFAGFVVIQFRYLFGGVENITETGYNYSEYARRGFGELAAVVFMTLLILLELSSAARRETPREAVTYNALNVLTVALVGVMVISALLRLLLYEEIYGFTRLRTYSHVAIIWLGALFVPYLVALLANRLRWFAPGALLCLLGFAATLNGLNVDRFIAAHNIDRSTRNSKLHTRYLLTLSDDALPELIPLLAGEDAEVKAVLGPGLACRVDRLAQDYGQAGWQSMHLAHQAAWDALQSSPVLLRYYVIHHIYGDYVYIGDERVTCSELLESFVLEPGLTSEYREGR